MKEVFEVKLEFNKEIFEIFLEKAQQKEMTVENYIMQKAIDSIFETPKIIWYKKLWKMVF